MFEEAFVAVSVLIFLHAASLFQSVHKTAFVFCAVGKNQSTLAVEFIIFPFTFVGVADVPFVNAIAITLTNGFKLFDQNFALTGGNPAKMSQLLALNIYDTMYGTTGWQGVGQAKAVIFFILVAVIALIQNKLTTSKEVQD